MILRLARNRSVLLRPLGPPNSRDLTPRPSEKAPYVLCGVPPTFRLSGQESGFRVSSSCQTSNTLKRLRKFQISQSWPSGLGRLLIFWPAHKFESHCEHVFLFQFAFSGKGKSFVSFFRIRFLFSNKKLSGNSDRRKRRDEFARKSKRNRKTRTQWDSNLHVRAG